MQGDCELMARLRRRRTFVEGAEELLKLFEELPDEARDILSDATKEGAKIVLQKAKIKAPVRSGGLKKSLDITELKIRKQTAKGWRVYSKGVRKGGVKYGFAVETGTSRMRAKPFIRPAYDESEKIVVETINDKIFEKLDDKWGD